MIAIETLTSMLPDIDPDVEAVHDGTKVGFYRFKSGDYEGVTFTYVNPKFTELPDGRLQLSFTHVIVEDPKSRAPTTDEAEEKFNKRIGDLLVGILEAADQHSGE